MITRPSKPSARNVDAAIALASPPPSRMNVDLVNVRSSSSFGAASNGRSAGSFRWWRLAHVNRALGTHKGAFPGLALQPRRHDVALHIGKPLLVDLVYLRTNFGTGGVAAALRHIHLDVQRHGLIGHTLSLCVAVSTPGYYLNNPPLPSSGSPPT